MIVLPPPGLTSSQDAAYDLVLRNGKIVDRIIGLKGKAEIEDAIKKALDTQASGQTVTMLAAPGQAQK